MHRLTQALQRFSNHSNFFCGTISNGGCSFKKQAPKHKADYFFSRIIQVSINALEPGSNLSFDDQDANFQLHQEDKQRVTFKRAGDGFLIDAVCEDGYTINFYPKNLPPPKKWIEKGY